jgi:predicted naringenin-chalcone synthase
MRPACDLARWAMAACVLAPVLVALGAPGWLRLPVVLALFCLAPGVALAPALRTASPRAELGLVVGVSLCVVTLVAQAALWLGVWNPSVFTTVLALACLAAILASRRGRAAGRPEAPRPGAVRRPRSPLWARTRAG